MYNRKRIAVIVPAYNEESSIKRAVRTVPNFVDLIIVVDDCSTDGTFAQVSSIAAKRLRVVRHRNRAGVGGAIMSGHRIAMKIGSDVDVVMAGDGQMDPAFLPNLLEPVTSGLCDFSKGNRFFRELSPKQMPPLRVVGNIGLSVLTKFATGYWRVFDSQNGYTAIKTDALRCIDLKNMNQGYQFENDLLVRLARSSCSVTDVPIPACYSDRQSDIRLGSFFFNTLAFLFRAILSRYFQAILKAAHSTSARTSSTAN